MSDVKLGQLIDGDAARDAIHIAVAPVVAVEDLFPGSHVGLLPDGRAGLAVSETKPIGVVDPFLTGKVATGEKFWLVLYPNTVTGMRHQWAHPSFGDSEPNPKTQPASSPEVESVLWVATYARSLGMHPDSLMAAAHAYIDSHDYVNVGEMEGLYVSSEFWKHFEVLTGKKGEGSFFSCSC